MRPALGPRALSGRVRLAAAVTAAALAAGSAPARAQENPPPVLPPDAPIAVAANGAHVPMPAIEALDCPTMQLVLRRLDESGYRGVAPLPADHPDRPIFEYENRLAARYYFNCIVPAHRAADPTAAFADGF